MSMKKYHVNWGDGTFDLFDSRGRYTHTYRDVTKRHCIKVTTDDVCATASVGDDVTTGVVFRFDEDTSDVTINPSVFTRLYENNYGLTDPTSTDIPQGAIYGQQTCTANNFEIVDLSGITNIGADFLMNVKGFSTLDFSTLHNKAQINSNNFVRNTDIVEFSISDVGFNFGSYTLADNTKLEKVRFGNTFTTSASILKWLGNYFLYNCTSLKDIDFSEFEKVTYIGYNFANGWAVTELDLTPMEALKTIDGGAFINLPNCKHIYLPWDGSEKLPLPRLGFNGGYSFQNIPRDCQIHVPCGSRELYETSSGWSHGAGHYVDDCDQYATIIINDDGESIDRIDGVDKVGDIYTSTFRKGSDVKILLTPADGWKFIQWSDGVIDNPRYFTNIQDDITLTPIMRNESEGEVCQSEEKQAEYKFVRLQVGESHVVERGIINWGDGSVTVMEEGQFDYTHEYADNNTKHSVYIDGECGSITGLTFELINNGTTFDVLVTKDGKDTLINSYSIQLDEVGTRSFTLTAQPIDDYEFVQWNNSNGDIISTDMTITYTPEQEDDKIYAIYKSKVKECTQSLTTGSKSVIITLE